MPNYKWNGRNRSGETQSGVIAAENRSAAMSILRKQQITVTGLSERDSGWMARLGIELKVPRKLMAVFMRQFSVMIEAGLPLVQCLDILGEQQEKKKFKTILDEVQADVEGGSSLAEAMSKQPKAFDDLIVAMVEAGESGGVLDVVLRRLAEYLDKIVRLRAQVRAALLYPVTVTVVAIGVVYVILWKVIPVFNQLYAGLGGEMPYMTQVVVGLSNFIGRWTPLIFLCVVVLVLGIRIYHRTESGRRVLDRLLLKIPVIGDLLLKIAVARFGRTLATLTVSGVPILEGLDITARTAGNAVIEDAIVKIREEVEQGASLSAPMAATGEFPVMATQMVAVGEQTGAIDQLLAKVADFYEEEVDIAVEGLMKLIEPMLIVFLGVVIGFIVTAMYLPLYSMLSQIG